MRPPTPHEARHRLDAVDDHPGAPGIQIKVTGGMLSVVLRSGHRPGTARVTFTALRGSSTGFIDVPFVGSADHVQAAISLGEFVAERRLRKMHR